MHPSYEPLPHHSSMLLQSTYACTHGRQNTYNTYYIKLRLLSVQRYEHANITTGHHLLHTLKILQQFLLDSLAVGPLPKRLHEVPSLDKGESGLIVRSRGHCDAHLSAWATTFLYFTGDPSTVMHRVRPLHARTPQIHQRHDQRQPYLRHSAIRSHWFAAKYQITRCRRVTHDSEVFCCYSLFVAASEGAGTV